MELRRENNFDHDGSSSLARAMAGQNHFLPGPSDAFYRLFQCK